MCICTTVHACTCTCSMYGGTCMCTSVCTCVCDCMYMYVCLHVCVCVCACHTRCLVLQSSTIEHAYRNMYVNLSNYLGLINLSNTISLLGCCLAYQLLLVSYVIKSRMSWFTVSFSTGQLINTPQGD